MTARWLAPAITLGAVLVGLAVVFDLAALRMVLAVLICLLIPGWGWARRFRTRDRVDTLALAVVLSICFTVAVSTTMVMAARWSTLGGLAALVVIGVVGFVPTQQVLARVQAAVPSRPAAAGHHDPEWVDWFRRHERPAETDQEQSEVDWVDWYAGARRRAAEERARTRALQRHADEQWAEWFRHAHPERVGEKALTRRPQDSSSRMTSRSWSARSAVSASAVVGCRNETVGVSSESRLGGHLLLRPVRLRNVVVRRGASLVGGVAHRQSPVDSPVLRRPEISTLTSRGK